MWSSSGCTNLVIEELAIAETEPPEARHTQENVLQTLSWQLRGGEVQLMDGRMLPLDSTHVLILHTCEWAKPPICGSFVRDKQVYWPQWCNNNVESFLQRCMSTLSVAPLTRRQKFRAKHSKWMQLLLSSSTWESSTKLIPYKFTTWKIT